MPARSSTPSSTCWDGNRARHCRRSAASAAPSPYPSRTKDIDEVDFSTGSVGLGVAMTLFASLAQDYLRLKGRGPLDEPPARMIALAGDAELDEGNVFEALLEGWKHDARNVWWIVDYNRQSLDAIVEDRLNQRIDALFNTMGWRVVTLKYGRALQQAFLRRGGDALRDWIDACPNALYSALVYKGGAGWRERLLADLGDVSGMRELLDDHDDAALHQLMTNLGGHDMGTVLDAFHGIGDDQPTCFLAYTIKGRGLPFEGHRDNHAGLMSPEQIVTLRSEMGIPEGEEWSPRAGIDLDPRTLDAFLSAVPLRERSSRRHDAAGVRVPAAIAAPAAREISTQAAFGRLLRDIARNAPELADAIVTTSPDVAVSTNLGGWVSARGVFDRRERDDFFEELRSAQRWVSSPTGQHLELGIAENNLFLMLAAFGLSHDLLGERLLPIGTLYDPFISRGLDALNYACYQDARFLLVATPSGLSLAPEGGAHQSVYTPLIGMGQPGLRAWEPAYADELAVILRESFLYLQADAGGSVYLRLSTRVLPQLERELDSQQREAILRGGYWLVPPGSGCRVVIAFCGAIVSEARAAWERIRRDHPDAGLLAITSPERLHDEWRREAERSHVARLLAPLREGTRIVSVIDGHPAALSWLGGVAEHVMTPLGVDRFGQSGAVPDLYRAHGIDADAICAAAQQALDRPAHTGSIAPPPAVGEYCIDLDLAPLDALCAHLAEREPERSLEPAAFLARAAARSIDAMPMPHGGDWWIGDGAVGAILEGPPLARVPALCAALRRGSQETPQGIDVACLGPEASPIEAPCVVRLRRDVAEHGRIELRVAPGRIDPAGASKWLEVLREQLEDPVRLLL
jgi:pyruvate dehydrogenase E1 component